MNEGIKLSNRELEFINLFELISSVKVKDCIIDEKFNRAIFLVEPTQVGIAIGKGGEKINAFKKLSSIDAEIVPYYEDLEKMARGCFMPFEIKDIKINENSKGEKILLVYVDPATKAKVIGASGKNVARARLILQRYFGIKNVIVV